MRAHINLPVKYVENSWSDTTIYDADGDVIASMRIYDEADEDNQEYLERRQKNRAELIVTAVNHHQELINRLENLVNVLDTVLPAKDEDVRGILEAVVFTRNEARETLKKVKK